MKRLISVIALAAAAAALLPLTTPATESFRAVYEKGAGDFATDLVIGSDDESAADFLLEPSAICVAPNGDVFVLETPTCRIYRFDAAGELVTTFGEEGEGPGYMHSPGAIDITPDGNLCVYEFGNLRFSVFTPDGEFVRTMKLQDFVWRFRVETRGTILAEFHEFDFQGTRGGNAIRLKRFSSDLATSTVIDSALIKESTIITEPVRTALPVPFHQSLVWLPTPAGNVVVGRTADYHLRLLSPAGDVLAEVTHDGTREKVTDADREAWFAGITHTTSEGGTMTSQTKGAPQYVRDNAEFPEYKPYFRSLYVDHEGYLLAETFEHDGDRAVYDVFDPGLTFVNRVSMPALAGNVIVGGFVYRIDVPDDGAAKVERLRLVASQTNP